MKSGLLSVTFRQLEASAIISLAVRGGLQGIEWGGDLHVPPDQPKLADTIGRQTREAGLEVSAYGSYYRLGDTTTGPFEAVLETANALQTGIIRVWTGRKASEEADTSDRKAVTDDGARIAELARQAGIRIACEWHANTLTDTAASAATLFAEVDHPNFLTFWQPRNFQTAEFSLQDLDTALPRLIGLHVFNWDVKTRARLPLADGVDAWKAYLAKASTRDPIFASLEFVADDDPQRMLEDAAALNRWLSEI